MIIQDSIDELERLQSLLKSCLARLEIETSEEPHLPAPEGAKLFGFKLAVTGEATRERQFEEQVLGLRQKMHALAEPSGPVAE